MGVANLLKNRKVQVVLAVALLALLLIFVHGVNLGIEFVGGVRIPVSLAHSVTPDTMASMIQTIKLRINKYGLSQANVLSIGDQEILVEIPQADPSVIKSVEQVLSQQGTFEAIVGGKQALNGSDILTNAVGGGSNEQVTTDSSGAHWTLGFAATRDGAEKFASVAQGKAYYPVFMFLDRPSNAVILVENSQSNSTPIFLNSKAIGEALAKDGDDIQLVFVDGSTKLGPVIANKSVVVMDEGVQQRLPSIYSQVTAAGFSVQNASRLLSLKSSTDMTPVSYTDSQGDTIINQWAAIGLLSGPTLSPGLASGYVSQFYQVTGNGAGATPAEQQADAVNEIKLLKTVISGGKLPVSTVIGSSYSIAPSLGRQFLNYSAVGVLLSVGIVAALIMLRYRRLVIAGPIMFINLIEMLITLAIIGTIGTVDLAAMAGIITLVGTGIDDQIIIMDEMLKKKKEAAEPQTVEQQQQGQGLNFRARFGRAFEIVVTIAIVAIAAQVPLFFSELVEIRGFAFAYIIGVLVGVLITRPTFGVILGELVGLNPD